MRNINKTSILDAPIYIINGIRYQLPRRNVKNRDNITMNNNIYIPDGTVYEINQKLYLDSIKHWKTVLIKTLNENSKYDLMYDSRNKKVFILPLSMVKKEQNKILVFTITNYSIVNNTIQTTLITLPTCSITSMTVTNDTGNILIGKINSSPMSDFDQN